MVSGPGQDPPLQHPHLPAGKPFTQKYLSFLSLKAAWILASYYPKILKWMVPEGKDRGHLYLEKGQWSHQGRKREVGVGFVVASSRSNLGRKEPLARVWTKQWPLLLY